MHLILLLSVLGLAWGIRRTGSVPQGLWSDRWQQTLTCFLLPPMLLFSGAIAVLWMGPYGEMVWAWEGWLSSGLAASFVAFAVVRWLHLSWQGRQTLQQIRAQPTTEFRGNVLRVLDTSTLYSAQIGFWQSELVMSQGLLETLDLAHLEAIFAHEQAHSHYRDTFYFFWLGWLRQITPWLPQTESLWQELLVLRELRADRWAAARTDALFLAEALLLVVEQYPLFPETVCAGFSIHNSPHRLTQRLEALLSEEEPTPPIPLGAWSWVFLAVVPLLSIPLHR